MVASLVLLIREGLEAALLVSILVAYLNKIGRKDLNKHIYFGTLSAVLVSLFIAGVFGSAYKSFGTLFEGLAGLFAVVILTYMILWMSNHSSEIKDELQKKASEAINSRSLLGLFFLAFAVVLREGVETVLFLSSMSASIPMKQILTGSVAGLFISVLLAILLFKSIYSFNLKKFFQYTGYILLVFAAGILGQATAELQAAGWLPGTISAWDTNWLINDNSVLGSVLSSIIGYSAQPTVLQVIFYLSYLAVIGFMVSPAFKETKSKGEGEYGDPFYPVGNDYSNPVYRLLRSNWFPILIQVVMAVFFIALLLIALLGINIGPFDNSGPLRLGVFESKEQENNLFILMLWIIWLPLITISALLTGRLWCGNLCPLRLVTEFASNLAKYITGKSSNTNPYLRTGWILPSTFILITLIVKTFDVQTVARNGAYLFIGIFAIAVLVGLLFRKGTWCSYVCPIGGWLSRIARLGVIGVRSKLSVCAECHTKECLNGSKVPLISAEMNPLASMPVGSKADRCPMFLNPSKLDSSRNCLGCWNCVKNCPKEKSAIKIGFRVPGAELLKPYAPDKWESIYIAGLIGMYIAAVQQGIFLPDTPYIYVFLGLISTAAATFLVLSKIVSWFGGITFREAITNLGYIFLPMEFATAIIAMGDDALEFFNITVPAAGILLSGGFVWSLILAVSIINNHVKGNRFALCFISVGTALVGLLFLWVNWFLSGQVIDLT